MYNSTVYTHTPFICNKLSKTSPESHTSLQQKHFTIDTETISELPDASDTDDHPHTLTFGTDYKHMTVLVYTGLDIHAHCNTLYSRYGCVGHHLCEQL